MRQLSTSLVNAITTGAAYKLSPKIRVEPTWVFIDTLSGSDAPGFADASGIIDDPVFQEIGFSPISNLLVTFYAEGGQLKYQIETGGGDIYPGSLLANLPAYMLAGGLTSGSMAAYLAGGTGTSDNQPCYLFGIGGVVDNLPAYLMGKSVDIFSNAGRMMIGNYARAIADTYHMNTGILFKYKFPSLTAKGNLNVWLRTSNNWDVNSQPDTGICLSIPNTLNGIAKFSERFGAETLWQDSYSNIVTSSTNYYWLRFEVNGSTIRYKHWADGASEPSEWQTHSHLCFNVVSGYSQIAFVRESGSAMLTTYIDDVQIYNPGG